jgi:dolichol-phosphate mannosyltransferase
MKPSDISPLSSHICVVLPLYKARNQIADVLRGVPGFIRTIVVVDDCSPDDSYERALAVSDKRIHFVRHEKNQGVGGAVLSGYKKAVDLGAEIIVKMDSDGQMDPSYLLPLISPLLAGEADYTKGNRFLHSRQLKAMPTLRRIGNLGLSFLTKLASGYWNVFDPSNGYTAITASVVNLIDNTAIDRRYFFETSMFLELGLLRAVVQDIYIPAHYADETSHLSEWNALLIFPRRLLSGFIKRIKIQYFLQDFNLVSLYLLSGLGLLIFGGSFGLYRWWLAVQTHVATPTGTVMLVVIPVILGVQFVLQAIALDVQNVPTRVIARSAQVSSRIGKD